MNRKIILQAFLIGTAVLFSGCSVSEPIEEVEVQTIMNNFNKESALENQDEFNEKVKHNLYRQGNPEQIYIAENPDIHFSEIETYTSGISLSDSLADIEDIQNISLGHIPENGSVFYSDSEIAVRNDNGEPVTFYFTNKTGASYPETGSAVISSRENVSLVIFKVNDGLYCSAVGRDISSDELVETVESLEAE